MQDAADRLRAFMERQKLSQAGLARAAGVSQPTVSRALRRRALRRGAARSRLFSYAGISEWPDRPRIGGAHVQVIAAFERVWDGSAAHAASIVKVIDALEDLGPRSQETRRD